MELKSFDFWLRESCKRSTIGILLNESKSFTEIGTLATILKLKDKYLDQVSVYTSGNDVRLRIENNSFYRDLEDVHIDKIIAKIEARKQAIENMFAGKTIDWGFSRKLVDKPDPKDFKKYELASKWFPTGKGTVYFLNNNFWGMIYQDDNGWSVLTGLFDIKNIEALKLKLDKNKLAPDEGTSAMLGSFEEAEKELLG